MEECLLRNSCFWTLRDGLEWLSLEMGLLGFLNIYFSKEQSM